MEIARCSALYLCAAEPIMHRRDEFDCDKGQHSGPSGCTVWPCLHYHHRQWHLLLQRSVCTSGSHWSQPTWWIWPEKIPAPFVEAERACWLWVLPWLQRERLSGWVPVWGPRPDSPAAPVHTCPSQRMPGVSSAAPLKLPRSESTTGAAALLQLFENLDRRLRDLEKLGRGFVLAGICQVSASALPPASSAEPCIVTAAQLEVQVKRGQWIFREFRLWFSSSWNSSSWWRVHCWRWQPQQFRCPGVRDHNRQLARGAEKQDAFCELWPQQIGCPGLHGAAGPYQPQHCVQGGKCVQGFGYQQCWFHRFRFQCQKRSFSRKCVLDGIISCWVITCIIIIITSVVIYIIISHSQQQQPQAADASLCWGFSIPTRPLCSHQTLQSSHASWEGDHRRHGHGRGRGGCSRVGTIHRFGARARKARVVTGNGTPGTDSGGDTVSRQFPATALHRWRCWSRGAGNGCGWTRFDTLIDCLELFVIPFKQLFLGMLPLSLTKVWYNGREVALGEPGLNFDR